MNKSGGSERNHSAKELDMPMKRYAPASVEVVMR
jgi:hypothetical protein